MNAVKPLLLTPGEPAGIGPDIIIQLAQQAWPVQLIAIADPDVLLARAKQLNLPLQIKPFQSDNIQALPAQHIPGTLTCLSIPVTDRVKPGQLNVRNANYVIQTLTTAATLCKARKVHALVTGPVHKGIINEAGISFSGHTEFFSQQCDNVPTVMLFVTGILKVALLTTHLPLKEVAAHITAAKLKTVITLLQKSLREQFGVSTPRLLIAGLNPHAGEQGYLGREEIEIITPVLNQLRAKGQVLTGPLPADTLFTPNIIQQADAILAMYHDQALPVVKYASFGHAVNVTLGLPFIRTSVDHGTALDKAGTGQADAGSMKAAIELALSLQHGHR